MLWDIQSNRSKNTAAQALANNDTMTKKSRFVDTRFHYTREMVNEGEIEVKRCDTQFMTADIFTKAMSKELMDRHGSTICGGTPTLNCQHALACACTDMDARCERARTESRPSVP